MSKPQIPSKVLLFSSIIYHPDVEVETIMTEISGTVGEIELRSAEMPFPWTDYYHVEMGTELKRVFISFCELVARDRLSEIKLATNGIEEKFAKNDKRTVNIDPGLISLENVVLATGKNYSHRIYLQNGIFADITLIYKDGEYKPLQWTYPDYASGELRDLLKVYREKLKEKLRG